MAQGKYPEVEQLITVALDLAYEETIRLRDKSVLESMRDLLQNYFNTVAQLGTIEHEVALKTINKQLAIAAGYAKASRTSLWDRFVNICQMKTLKLPKVWLEDVSAASGTLQSIGDNELLEMSKHALDADLMVVETLKDHKEMKKALLRVYMRMHIGLYILLGVQKLISFVGKHTFILLIPVGTLGIGYSWLFGKGKAYLARYFQLGFWGLAVLLIAQYIFKEYVLSKKLKAVRLRTEKFLLFPVVHRVFQANMQGLLFESMDRQPMTKTD